MKVSILGAGAIGSMFGGLLQHHAPDVEVVLVARGAHGEAMAQRQAVTLVGPWGSREVAVKVALAPDKVAGSNVVVVTVKSQGTEAALRAASPFLGQATLVSLQNGINHPTLERFVPPERLVLGMTATNMVIQQPGVVSLQLNGATVVGPPPGSDRLENTAPIAALLRRTGLSIVQHPNIGGVQYNKLAINALGYASCLSNLNFITEAICHPAWRAAVARPLIDECAAVYSRAGIQLAPIPGRPGVPQLRRFLQRLDWPIAGRGIGWFAHRLYNRKPIVFSLLQDLRQGKRTEVDYVNGQIVQLARDKGQDAPYNRLVCEIAHELEVRGPASFVPREQVIARFVQTSRDLSPASCS